MSEEKNEVKLAESIEKSIAVDENLNLENVKQQNLKTSVSAEENSKLESLDQKEKCVDDESAVKKEEDQEAKSLVHGELAQSTATIPTSSTTLSRASENDEIVESKPVTMNASQQQPTENGVYTIKWINYFNSSIPIILQNENGPCPLIAIANVLLLRKQIEFKANLEFITAEKLIQFLGDNLLKNVPKELENEERLNFEQNLSDALFMLNKLQFGLDVNIRFTSVNEFEYTRECNVFDLFNINLYHGWLVDPQQTDILPIIKNLSYNQLVEKIINLKGSNNETDLAMAMALEEFLDSTASQLTAYGLIEIQQTIKEHELAVLFRNNHFSTLFKHKNHLYVLVTDQGFLNKQVVWETLSTIDGDVYFCDSNFQIYTESPSSASKNSNTKESQHLPTSSNEQSDYMLALSLQDDGGDIDHRMHNLTDEQYAYMLQQEEQKLARLEHEQEQRRAQQQPTDQAANRSNEQNSSTRQKKKTKNDKDCRIV